MMREGCAISRCTMEPLICEIGSARGIRDKPVRTTISDKSGAVPARSRQPAVLRPNAEHAVGVGLHLRCDWGRFVYVDSSTGSGQASSSTTTPAGASNSVPTERHFTFVPTRSSKPFTTAGRSHVAASFTTGTAAHDTRRSRTSSCSKAGIEPSAGTVGDTLPPKPNANIIVSQAAWIWRGDLKSQGLCRTPRLFNPRFRVD